MTVETLNCSFCSKTQHQVRKLIAGPKTFICDECVGLCNAIIAPEDGHTDSIMFGRRLTALKLASHAREPHEDAASVIVRARAYAEFLSEPDAGTGARASGDEMVEG